MYNRIKFLSSKIKQNPISLLHAIEDVSEYNFCSEEYEFKTFTINKILAIAKRDSNRTDFRLDINIRLDNSTKIYKIQDWFTYNYKTKEFDLTNNYILQFE